MCDGHHALLASAVARGFPYSLPPGRDLSGHGRDAGAGVLGDAFDGFCYLAVWSIVGLLLLYVQVLGVLADDHKVNRVREGRRWRNGFDGSDIGVKVEALAESNDGR